MSEQDEVTKAIDVVAHQALANDGGEPKWENYPEIAQGDWMAVQQRVTKLALQTAPTTKDYKAAYDLLCSRADPTC